MINVIFFLERTRSKRKKREMGKDTKTKRRKVYTITHTMFHQIYKANRTSVLYYVDQFSFTHKF